MCFLFGLGLLRLRPVMLLLRVAGTCISIMGTSWATLVDDGSASTHGERESGSLKGIASGGWSQRTLLDIGVATVGGDCRAGSRCRVGSWCRATILVIVASLIGAIGLVGPEVVGGDFTGWSRVDVGCRWISGSGLSCRSESTSSYTSSTV